MHGARPRDLLGGMRAQSPPFKPSVYNSSRALSVHTTRALLYCCHCCRSSIPPHFVFLFSFFGIYVSPFSIFNSTCMDTLGIVAPFSVCFGLLQSCQPMTCRRFVHSFADSFMRVKSRTDRVRGRTVERQTQRKTQTVDPDGVSETDHAHPAEGNRIGKRSV